MSNGENMIIKVTLLIIFFAAQAYAQTSSTIVKEVSSKNNGLSVNEFVEKYWQSRSNEVLYIKDNMRTDSRIDLVNENFSISYSKCFEVAPTQEAANINENNKTASNLIFTRTSNCKHYKDKNVTNWFSIKFVDFLTKKEADLYFSNKVNTSPVVFMNQVVNLNNHKAEISASIFLSTTVATNNEYKKQLKMRWEMNILCEGKEYEQFRFTFMTESYDELLEFVTTKKYEIPEDFMQIISTFKCRKDR